jgi:hypothetical protein
LQDKRVDYRSILTRSALVSSINSMNLLSLVPAEVRAAYELLTSEFNPLELCKKLDPLLASLEVRRHWLRNMQTTPKPWPWQGFQLRPMGRRLVPMHHCMFLTI